MQGHLLSEPILERNLREESRLQPVSFQKDFSCSAKLIVKNSENTQIWNILEFPTEVYVKYIFITDEWTNKLAKNKLYANSQHSQKKPYCTV